MNQYWEEGYAAFQNGALKEECPYPYGSDSAYHWNLGFETAQEEDEG